MAIRFLVAPPTSFSANERTEFVDLVKKDPQVNKNTLPDLVEQAQFLAFLYLAEKLAGTNAIKSNSNHQRTIEKLAGVSLPKSDYFGEVGYLHVAAGNRGARLGDILLMGTLAAVKSQGLFATIQSTNVASCRLFERHGFTRVGKSWPSREVNDQVYLYVRSKL